MYKRQGFVGSNVAKVIAAAGHHVTVTGRNRYLAPIGKDHQGRNYRTNFRRADIRDAGRISQLCIGQDVVIHSAARSSPFDSLSELESVNVKGTENVIDGCMASNVSRLVHISSTSIFFDFKSNLEVSDSCDLPKKFSCGYAESKALAEQKIMDCLLYTSPSPRD